MTACADSSWLQNLRPHWFCLRDVFAFVTLRYDHLLRCTQFVSHILTGATRQQRASDALLRGRVALRWALPLLSSTANTLSLLP